MNIVVVGSGRMAPGISAACASVPGARVTVAARSLERARSAAGQAVAFSGVEVDAAPFAAGAFADAELVIETVTEDREIKLTVLAAVERWIPATAILVTNTSSLPLSELAGALERPERFGGLHFLHPAHLTEVVEVVPTEHTSAATRKALVTFARALGKVPIALRQDIPGFIWNRLQFAVLRECLHLIDLGIADIETIDAAVSDGLAPRWLAGGPFACADLGGLETFSATLSELAPTLASDREPSRELTSRATEGGAFYRWTPAHREDIGALRERVLAEGRELARQRRAAMPDADTT